MTTSGYTIPYSGPAYSAWGEPLEEYGIAKVENIEAAHDIIVGLLGACKAVMRSDGHYKECPCNATANGWKGLPRGASGHIFMPNNPRVAICEQLRAAIAQATTAGVTI